MSGGYIAPKAPGLDFGQCYGNYEPDEPGPKPKPGRARPFSRAWARASRNRSPSPPGPGPSPGFQAEPGPAKHYSQSTSSTAFNFLPHLVGPNNYCTSFASRYARLMAPKSANTHCCKTESLDLAIACDPDLSIKSDSLPLTQTSQHKTTIAAIRHLLIFRKLTSVSLRAPTGFQIDDNMILRMAEAGPCLESLQMLSPSPVRGLKPTPRTTLLSLLYLAENCPRLEYLKLAVDASIIPNLDDRYFSAWPHSLFYWEVANSLITSPLRVARFLSGVFPLLEEVFCRGDARCRAPSGRRRILASPVGRGVGYVAALPRDARGGEK
ncbi:hypothetical protein B0H14DRAFT_3780244 [Mycena olivaceomarginata]|nr:hypothetical protein B0H14DRAFT_3780244 [Mycena olivaceomarginata]